MYLSDSSGSIPHKIKPFPFSAFHEIHYICCQIIHFHLQNCDRTKFMRQGLFLEKK